jgi:hypothetical protein
MASVGRGEVCYADERFGGGGVVTSEDAEGDYGLRKTRRHFG